MRQPIALVTHPACAAHDPGAGHPESAARLSGILEAVRADPWLGRDVLVEIEARPVEPEDLLLAHTPAHVTFVRGLAELAARSGAAEWIDPDTAVSPRSFLAALAAAGCAVTAAEEVASGGASAALALARPPGHHAAQDRAAGFCLFNNVVVAARRLQADRLAERILIVDWDVHHGDGTQAIVWEDPTIAYLSLHLFPHYPGTGTVLERGGGEAEGNIANVPLAAGADARAYRRHYSEALRAVLRRFTPDFVLVSAGFDSLAGDPLGGLLLEPRDLHGMTVELQERTGASADGRVVAVLEGGYVPERAGLGAADVLRALAGLPAAAAREAGVPAAF